MEACFCLCTWKEPHLSKALFFYTQRTLRGKQGMWSKIKTKHIRSLSGPRLKYFLSPTTKRGFLSILTVADGYLKYILYNNTPLLTYRTNTETALE